jgi:hypothetical protein
MILCAERSDREQPEPLLPTFGGLSASSSAWQAPLPSEDWAERQTQMCGLDTMTLFADRHRRRLVSRAMTTTS